jgi:hypothetical protein
VRFAPDYLGFVSRAVRPRMVAVTNLKEKEIIMSNTHETQTTTSKSPSHIVYQVRDREGGKGFFTRIGAAWPHKDGKGFNIKIESVPLDGRITLRVASEKKE